jgi:hypothetical protein
MDSKKLPLWKRFTFYLIGLFLLLLLISLVGEVGVRVMVYLRNKSYPTLTTEADEQLGSRAMGDFHWDGTVKDADGKVYPLHFNTDHQGFRLFGDTASAKKKVLFLGDSFTQAIEVSDDKTYYALLADSLDIEAFAYGCRGFSTLQELMFLRKYLPVIQPDVVVLQFCSNDFINNHYELERHSQLNNNRRRRPYLQPDGSVKFEVPARIGWDWLAAHSMFYDMLFTKTERYLNQAMPADASSEFFIEHEGAGYPPFSESIARTGQLLSNFKDSLPPSTQLLVFSVDNYQPFFETIGGICYENDIPFVGYIPQRLDSLDLAGQHHFALDGAHWNELGHAVAAEVLECELGDLVRMK